MGATIFFVLDRAVLAGARVVVTREVVGAAAFPTAGIRSSPSADGVREIGGAIGSPVALAGLNE
eukprot:58969-Pleurochrysis_carterae.AAC.1